MLARFGRLNQNHYPTMFGVVGVVRDAACRDLWYRVQLPVRPNGAVGYVAAVDLRLSAVRTRIDVDVTAAQLTLFRSGRRLLTATVAIGASATPTPLGRYYVNQRLIPDDAKGPFGPAAIGISAFSPVLTGWAQGGRSRSTARTSRGRSAGPCRTAASAFRSRPPARVRPRRRRALL